METKINNTTGSDAVCNILCSVCKGKNKSTEAEKFCSDCHDYYCSMCVRFHDDIPALKNHQIIDKVESTAHLLAVPTDRCKEHKNKIVDMYCKSHDTVMCSACMLVKHSNCNDKFYVPEYIKDNAEVAKPNNTKKHLETIAKRLDQLQKALNKDKEELTGNKEKSLREIRQFRERINQLMDQFEKNTVKELEWKFKAVTDKIDLRFKELQDSITEVNAALDSLKSAEGNMSQMFISIKTAKEVVSSAKEKMETTNSQIFPTDILFEANNKLQSVFDEMKGLGSIRNKLFVAGSKKYPINVSTDKYKCHITSACTLDNGTIILADNKNSNLKQLHSSTYTVTDSLDVPSSPWQVCAIRNQNHFDRHDVHEIAVCCSNSMLIQFVSVTWTMEKTKQIKTGFQCRGLAYSEMKLFVSTKTSVYVYSLSGDKLQKFGQDQFGQRLLSSICALAISNDNSKIYVADYNTGFMILDMNGQLVGQYNGDKLKGAISICLDNNDNVLVCGVDSKNVLQFSPNGQWMSDVLNTGENCRAICCKDNSKLIVGFHLKDEIEVYDFDETCIYAGPTRYSFQ